MCEYGDFTLLSMPQLIANRLGSGVAGKSSRRRRRKQPGGNVGDARKRGAVVVLKNPGGFEMLLDRPKDPDVSNVFTIAAPKWS